MCLYALLWLWAENYSSYATYRCTAVNHCIIKSDHKTEIFKLLPVFQSTLKIGSFIRLHTFIFCLAMSSIMFHLYMKSIAKTTLQFNRAYNIPFGSVYWFTPFKPTKFLYAFFFFHSSTAHCLFTCKRDSYMMPFNPPCFLFNTIYSCSMVKVEKKNQHWW